MDWYPWHFLLFKTDTMHLGPYQDGCYRRLIDHYMETRQSLPDSDVALARIAGDSEANWMALAASVVRPFFFAKNGRLFHKRCELELAKQDRLIKKLSESGKNGSNKRWNKNNNIDSPPIATPLGGLKGSDSRGEERKRIKKVKNTSVQKSFENISIAEIAPWLNEKRAQGKYLTIDEFELLEMFKDYCRSKNPKYADYTAAFRNSFKWDNAPKKGNRHDTPTNRNLTKWDRKQAALDRAENELNEAARRDFEESAGEEQTDQISDLTVR